MNMQTQIDWQAVGVIATLLAVLVALFLHFYQQYRQSRVRLKIQLATQGRFSDKKRACLIVTNYGLIPSTVTRILVRYPNGHIGELIHSPDYDLPKTLMAQQNFEIDHPGIPHNIDSIVSIYVEDSTGKRWKCSQNSIKTARKILANYIGKRLLYTSMGDKQYEDEIDHK